jgi:hypothetical protein
MGVTALRHYDVAGFACELFPLVVAIAAPVIARSQAKGRARAAFIASSVLMGFLVFSAYAVDHGTLIRGSRVVLGLALGGLFAAAVRVATHGAPRRPAKPNRFWHYLVSSLGTGAFTLVASSYAVAWSGGIKSELAHFIPYVITTGLAAAGLGVLLGARPERPGLRVAGTALLLASLPAWWVLLWVWLFGW